MSFLPFRKIIITIKVKAATTLLRAARNREAVSSFCATPGPAAVALHNSILQQKALTGLYKLLLAFWTCVRKHFVGGRLSVPSSVRQLLSVPSGLSVRPLTEARGTISPIFPF